MQGFSYIENDIYKIFETSFPKVKNIFLNADISTVMEREEYLFVSVV